jgi:energy-coupling factor transporter ATP-binding protein EcfA2
MITHLSVKNFTAVPYLETSALMKNHPDGIAFSKTKPNVIVGPNGSGKSALLRTLALQTLSYFTSESNFDKQYVKPSESDCFWKELRKWTSEFSYLPGLTCETDNAPALFYRPGHIPGDESSTVNAMVNGYFDQAKEYSALVRDKSSGQQSKAVLAKQMDVLLGKMAELEYHYSNWGYGKDLGEIDRKSMPWEFKALVLKKRYVPEQNAIPLLIMDEPEQSLDAREEVELWRTIAGADCSRMQIIVATHSLYPLLHPERFSLIEALPGYAQEVSQLFRNN